jgi:hypothetical protein
MRRRMAVFLPTCDGDRRSRQCNPTDYVGPSYIIAEGYHKDTWMLSMPYQRRPGLSPSLARSTVV